MTEPTLHYDLHLMPAGRMAFRRWRWELWHGQHLIATGWRMSEHHAERALRTAASRMAHRLLGLRPLRPELTRVPGGFEPGAVARLECGAVSCMLVPRELPT